MLVAMQPISKPNVVSDTHRKIEKLRRNPSEARQEAGKRTDDSVSGKGTELLKNEPSATALQNSLRGTPSEQDYEQNLLLVSKQADQRIHLRDLYKIRKRIGRQHWAAPETFLKICTRQTYALSASNCAQPAAARRVSSQTVLAP